MFEIGDKVIYHGADKAAYKREGTVVSIEDKDGKPQLTVELDGGETFTAPIDDWSRKFNNSARNAKLAVGDKVRVWQYPIRGQYGKVVKVGLMEYDVEVDGKVYPGIDYRRVVKMPAANACTSTNSVVRNAMAAKRVARNARTDWEQEIYKLTERIKALVQKSQRENGDDYPTTVFKDALKAMRGF